MDKLLLLICAVSLTLWWNICRNSYWDIRRRSTLTVLPTISVW